MAMDIQKQLCAVAKALKATFTLNGKQISYQDVFAETGLLPAIAKRADQLSSLCLGYGIGVTFEEVEKARLGVKAKFDDITPNILRLACMTDVICELMNSSPSKDVTSLDELLYD